MKRAVNQTIKEFCLHLSSGAPTPGGGSGAALSGVMGSSLMMMVGNVSFNKPSYEKLDASIRKQVEIDFKVISELHRELTDLIEEDIEAFNGFMFSLKLPKDTNEEILIRDTQLKKATQRALEVPLKTAGCCLKLLESQENLAKYGIKTVISDVGVGSLLALASLEAAILNVHINLPWIEDENYKQEVVEHCKNMLEKGKACHAIAMAIVHERIGTF